MSLTNQMSTVRTSIKQFLEFLVKYTKTSKSDSHVIKNVKEEDVYRRLLKTVAPLQFLPYETQLKIKQQYCRKTSLNLKNILTKKTKRNTVSKQLLDHIEQNEGLLFGVPEVTPSPSITDYRNKDKCVIGIGADGKPTIGGFTRPGKFPKMDVVNGKHMIIKQQHYEVILAFQELVRESGRLAPDTLWTDRHPDHSNWRNFLVRSNEAGDLMIGVTMIPPIGVTNEEMLSQNDKARDDTINFFLYGPGRNFDVKSLWFQYNSQINRDKFQLLCGQPTIQETLCGYKFNISPESFFQVNTKATEVLYEKVKEMCGLNKNTILLDVCCGAGTIGIILSSYVRAVIGIEKIEQAVRDAIVNGELNDVENAAFITGTAERKLHRVFDRARYLGADTEFVAVVNPPRKGLGVNVIRALRNSEQIRKIVYISCKSHGVAKNNFVWLCQAAGHPDEKITGPPFLPTKSAIIDMFPHTKHYELVLLFER